MILTDFDRLPTSRHVKEPMIHAVRVLLVDDFKPWRSFAASLLEKNPECQIVCGASDGLEAIQKAEQFQPDLIVLDIGLPKLSGIEATPSIRKAALGSKILFLSENCDRDIAVAALNAGGRGYVVKSDKTASTVTSNANGFDFS
jgi:two-component system, NarL family, nitrate/nitrite response regulator NarL